MRIVIETENSLYASIDAEGRPHYWVEREGGYWSLRTGSSFDSPVQRWRANGSRESLEQVIPLAIAAVMSLAPTKTD